MTEQTFTQPEGNVLNIPILNGNPITINFIVTPPETPVVEEQPAVVLPPAKEGDLLYGLPPSVAAVLATKDVLTPQEAANLLGKSVFWMYRLIKAGEIEVVRVHTKTSQRGGLIAIPNISMAEFYRKHYRSQTELPAKGH